MADTPSTARRLRLAAGWALTVLLLAVYVLLPDGDERVTGQDGRATTDETPPEARRLEIVGVQPAEPTPGARAVVSFDGARDATTVRVLLGKEELPVLARRANALVVQLPPEAAPGHLKLRVAAGEERSKPYDLNVKAPAYRKHFRNVVGGAALLLIGIALLARGAREATGLDSAQRITRFARRRLAALGFGSALGALMQSTTAAAGLLAGLVSSNVLGIAPAAAAFLGAQVGAALPPIVVTGLIEPREGLLVVAVGAVWLGLASDRRAGAAARAVLGTGLIAFGLQLLRSGFEPLGATPAVLATLDRLRATGPLSTATCAAMGVALVAAFQGPAPVLLVVLGLAETTGHWDLRTALAVLSGSGLGAAVGALLTTPVGSRSRRLAELNLLLGLASTTLVASSLDVWVWAADRVVAGSPEEIRWGKRAFERGFGWHLAVAFAMCQLAAAAALVPFAGKAAGLIERLRPERGSPPLETVGDAAGVVRSAVLGVVRAEQAALDAIDALALGGRREEGRTAEHHLADAQGALDRLLEGPVRALPATPEGSAGSRLSFASLQLQRSLGALLRAAEHLTDHRVTSSTDASGVAPLSEADEQVLKELQPLLRAGIEGLVRALGSSEPLDLDDARAREIHLNRIEARARGALVQRAEAPESLRTHLAVLELVDAYESAGNHVYRFAEALGTSVTQRSAATA